MFTHWKRIFPSLICALTGFLHFILMLLTYASFFVTRGGRVSAYGYSAYESLVFGDASIANSLTGLLSAADQNVRFAFLLTLLSILLILSILLAAGLLVLGVLGLLGRLAAVGPFKADSRLHSSIAQKGLLAYLICQVLAAVCLVIPCLTNSYSGTLLEAEISLGLRPSIGFYLLLLLAAAAFVTLLLLEKKSAKTAPAPTPVYRCDACGATAEAEGACAVCGADAVAEVLDAELTKEKKPISRKALCIGGGAVLAIVILIAVFTSIPWPQTVTYVVPENDLVCVYHPADGTTLVLANGKCTEGSIAGRVTQSVRSVDGKALACLTEDGYLYFCTKNGPVAVAEGVSAFKLSTEGNALAYTQGNKTLLLYTTKDKETTLLTENLVSSRQAYYYLSPNGKSVAYTEGEEKSVTLCVWKNGESAKVGDGFYPIGLSDNAALLYYYDQASDTVFVSSEGKDPVKLMEAVSAQSKQTSIEFRYNAARTQVLFSTESGWYLSENGGERKLLSEKTISKFADISDLGIVCHDNLGILTTPLLDFKGQYFLTSTEELCYVNDKAELLEIAKNVKSFRTTVSGNALYYLDGESNLYRAEKPGSTPKKIASDVYRFVIAPDGKGCYYMDAYAALMHVDASSAPLKIADKISSLTMTQDGYALFLIDDTEKGCASLYKSRNGEVKILLADKASSVDATAVSAYYTVAAEDGTYSIYGASEDAAFELLLTAVEHP